MSVVVVLYSKYSNTCEKLLQMMSTMDFRKICVDHEEVRRLILKEDQKYSIRVVPSILVFFSTGIMKKYEGSDAFVWVKETLEKMNMIQASTTPSPSPSPPPPTVYMAEAPSPLLASRPNPPPTRKENEESQPFSSLKPRESIAVEPILDPESVPDMRRAMDTTPLIGAKSKKSTVSSPPPDKMVEDVTPMRGIKSDKQENIMSLAQQMQKQREVEDEKI